MGQMHGRPSQPSLNSPHRADRRTLGNSSSGWQAPVCEQNEREGVLRWLSALLRQKLSWSPALVAGEFWRFLISIGNYYKVVRVLKLRPFDEVVQNWPSFAFKYAAPEYLAKGLTLRERLSCFVHHYRRLHSTFREDFLRQVLLGNVTLYEISNHANCFTLTMNFPELPGRLEGELSLDLRVDGERVFTLSFIIVPGWVVKSEVAETLLITRVQGASGSLRKIRLARRVLHEFFLGKLAVAALQGVANALGIGELHAVCATKQRSFEKERAAKLESIYDDFFDRVGMIKSAAGFYFGAIPLRDKPLILIQGRNRSRARKRRALRQEVQSVCAAFLLGAARRTAQASSSTAIPIALREATESSLRTISCTTRNNRLTP